MFFGRGQDDALKQCRRLLCRISDTLRVALMEMTDIAPYIAGSHSGVFMITVGTTAGANRPQNTTIRTNLFTHMVALMGSASLGDALAMKAVLCGFRIQQNNVVLACIVFLEVAARLVVPDDFVFEARSLAARVETEDLIQNDFCIVTDTPIEMHIEATSGSQQRVQQCERVV